MSRHDDAHLWTLARRERAAIAEDLAQLTDEQWRHGTLCSEWDVEDVVAHLTAAASLNQWQWLRSMIGARFRPDVHNDRRLAEHRGATPAETLELFTAIIESTTAPSSDTAAFLGEILVHGQDIRIPLGLSRAPGIDALTPVAEFFAARDFAVASKSNIAGLSLEAVDGPFRAGDGPLVRGSTHDLVMAMAGRPATVDALEGPGVPTLRQAITSASTR